MANVFIVWFIKNSMTITERFKTPLDLEMEKEGFILRDYLTYYGRYDADILDVRTSDIPIKLSGHGIKYQISIDANELDHSCKKLYVKVDDFERAGEILNEIDRVLWGY